MGEAIGEAALLDRCGRIAAADHLDRVQARQNPGQREGPLGKAGHLKDAQRAIPEDRARARQGGLKGGNGLGAHVQHPPARRDLVGGHDTGLRVVVKGIGDDHVHREHQAALAPLQERPGCLNGLLLHQRVPCLKAHCRKEGVGHPAADEQTVALLQQPLYHANFVGDFSAAQDGDEGPLGVLHGAPQELQFLLHQETGDGLAAPLSDHTALPPRWTRGPGGPSRRRR